MAMTPLFSDLLSNGNAFAVTHYHRDDQIYILICENLFHEGYYITKCLHKPTHYIIITLLLNGSENKNNTALLDL